MNTRIVTTLILLLAAANAAAHGPIPLKKFACPSDRILVRQDFQFTTDELLDYAACLIPTGAATFVECTSAVPTSAICSTDTCGDFDDDFGVAKRMALNYCAASSADPSSLVTDSINLVVTSPATFYEPDHHTSYSFGTGLGGFCRYCDPPKPDK